MMLKYIAKLWKCIILMFFIFLHHIVTNTFNAGWPHNKHEYYRLTLKIDRIVQVFPEISGRKRQVLLYFHYLQIAFLTVQIRVHLCLRLMYTPRECTRNKLYIRLKQIFQYVNTSIA